MTSCTDVPIAISRSDSQRLPPEIWREVFEHDLSSADLARISLTCQMFYSEAEPELYRRVNLEGGSPGCWQPLLDAVTKSPRRIFVVRSLRVKILHYEHNDPEEGTEILRMINKTLRKLYNLKELFIFNQYMVSFQVGSAEILFEGCTFQLLVFAHQLTFANDLIEFLARQSAIEEFHEVNTSWVRGIILPPDALPRLRILAAGVAFLHVTNTPRHITHLSISFYYPNTVEGLFNLMGRQLVSLRLERNGRSVTPALPTFVCRQRDGISSLKYIELWIRTSTVSLSNLQSFNNDCANSLTPCLSSKATKYGCPLPSRYSLLKRARHSYQNTLLESGLCTLENICGKRPQEIRFFCCSVCTQTVEELGTFGAISIYKRWSVHILHTRYQWRVYRARRSDCAF